MDVSGHPTSATLAYLYSGQFIPPPKGLFAQAALAPLSGEKIDLRQLVVKIYTAGFMDLVESNRVALEAVTFKKFLGKENSLVPRLLVEPPAQPDDLPGLLLSRIAQAQKPEERRVREVVIRIVGGRDSTDYPWFLALGPALTGAVKEGYVTQPEKKPGVLKAMFNPTEALTRVYPVAARVEALNGAAAAVQARLEAFERNLGASAAILCKEIENGVDACKTVPDAD